MDSKQLDLDIVAIWLRKDPKRWLAGVLAGLFAGAVALAFACILCKVNGGDALLPIKIAALPILGRGTTDLHASAGILALGLITAEALFAFLGFLYAHFTGTNSLSALLAIGFVWGIFGWIFINNLYIQSFRAVFDASISSGAAFPIWIIFGLSLTSVSFFDRLVRAK